MTLRVGVCNDDEEPFFYREWGGTEMGCEMLEAGEARKAEILDFNTWY